MHGRLEHTIDSVSSVAQASQDALRLINKIDLESNDELEVVGLLPPLNRNASDEINERFAALLVVDQDELAFLKFGQLLLQVVDDGVVREVAEFSRLDVPARGCGKVRHVRQQAGPVSCRH